MRPKVRIDWVVIDLATNQEVAIADNWVDGVAAFRARPWGSATCRVMLPCGCLLGCNLIGSPLVDVEGEPFGALQWSRKDVCRDCKPLASSEIAYTAFDGTNLDPSNLRHK